MHPVWEDCGQYDDTVASTPLVVGKIGFWTVSGRAAALAGGLLLAGLFACSDAKNPSEPTDRTPTIVISGIQNGGSSQVPVTLSISVDIGTYSATLNGAPMLSGRTVSAPGAYVLVVTARNGSATASLQIQFEITLAGETFLIVRMIDLGRNDAGGGGDAILLTDSSAAGSRHALIDAGPAGVGASDPGFVGRRLTALGIDTLEVMILSHAHSDHFDGIPGVLQNRVLRRFVHNDQRRNFTRYNDIIAQASQQAGEVIVPTAITALDVGLGSVPSRVVIIPPLSTFLTNSSAGSSELNDGSIGAEVRKGPFRMFLTGDGEIRANERWRSQFSNETGNVDILKLGHHGANDATFDNGFNGPSTWVTHTAPDVIVISANGSTHPRINATNYVLSLPATQTYCTSVHGDIEIRVGETGVYSVTVEQNAAADCAPGSDAST